MRRDTVSAAETCVGIVTAPFGGGNASHSVKLARFPFIFSAFPF